MLSELQEQIQKTKLTKIESQIADYIINNISKFCFMTSTDLAQQLGVSHSSIIRFTRTIGYRGYSDFQRYVRKIYNSQVSEQKQQLAIPAKMLKKKMELIPESSMVTAVTSLAIENIQSVIERNSEKKFENAANVLIESQNKYLVGYRGTQSTISFLSIILKHMLPNVYPSPAPGLNVFDYLSDISSKDSVIIVSFPRYSKICYLAAEMAHKVGAKIIVFTDSPTAPLAKFADYLFTMNISSLTFYNSQAISLICAEILTTIISRKIGISNEYKLELIDGYLTQTELY